jgi:hypothetical protein
VTTVALQDRSQGFCNLDSEIVNFSKTIVISNFHAFKMNNTTTKQAKGLHNAQICMHLASRQSQSARAYRAYVNAIRRHQYHHNNIKTHNLICFVSSDYNNAISTAADRNSILLGFEEEENEEDATEDEEFEELDNEDQELLSQHQEQEEEEEEEEEDLEPERQYFLEDVTEDGYVSLPTEDCEFFVAYNTTTGKLDLRNASYKEPHSQTIQPIDPPSPSLPNEARRYHLIPWYSQFDGNLLKNQEPKVWIWKYYLVEMLHVDIIEEEAMFNEDGEQLVPVKLDLKEIYVADGASKTITKSEVDWVAPPNANSDDLRLRIKANGDVMVDVVQGLPDWEQTVEASALGVPALSGAEEARMLGEAYHEGGEIVAAESSAVVIEEKEEEKVSSNRNGTGEDAVGEETYDADFGGSSSKEKEGGGGGGEGKEEKDGKVNGKADQDDEGEADGDSLYDIDSLKDFITEFDDDEGEADYDDDFESPEADF